MRKAVQQIMLGSVTGSEAAARATLHRIKVAGYEGIELNRFMIHPSSMMVRLMTRAAGMPTGKGGKLDWKALLGEAGLSVISLHTDLGSLEREGDQVVREAREFGTDTVVITGMYRFDYSDEGSVRELAKRLNKAGEALRAQGISLLYHNHNVELLQVKPGLRAYDVLLSDTDPACVGFPPEGPRSDADSEAGQHGAGHRQYGSGWPSGNGHAKRCPDCCAGKP